MLREDLVNLKIVSKLFSLPLSRVWDLDHDARMDLIDERDGPFPDPIYARKLTLGGHNNAM